MADNKRKRGKGKIPIEWRNVSLKTKDKRQKVGRRDQNHLNSDHQRQSMPDDLLPVTARQGSECLENVHLHGVCSTSWIWRARRSVTSSTCETVSALKNGRASVRSETCSVTGKSPRLWPNRST